MKCLNCGTMVLIKGAQIEDGTFLLATDEPKKIEGEGSRSFVNKKEGCNGVGPSEVYDIVQTNIKSII